MQSKSAKINLPKPIHSLFTPKRGDVRYRLAHGGRGSGKSFSFALMAAVYGYIEPLRILCTRELQISIKESMFAEIKNAINSYDWLAAHYEIGESFIRGRNGTEFIFRGLRHNMSAIKSMAQIDLCIVEEAEDVPEQSWRDLLPTVRAEKSEIWAVWNPRRENSPVDTRFRKNTPDNAVIAECHYWHNPWFPEVLDRERQNDQRILDSATYAHIWEGAYLTNSKAQILSDKLLVQEFTPGQDWNGPYYGVDWGFSQDPTAGVKAWVHANNLYIEYDASKVGLELDETSEYLRAKLPGIEKYVSRADSARPETISYLKRNGLPKMQAVTKWAGSVEDGIAHIRRYQNIIVHPRCRDTIQELRLYSYKVDKLTGDILPDIVDAHNHCIDSLRYSLAPLIKPARMVMIG